MNVGPFAVTLLGREHEPCGMGTLTGGSLTGLVGSDAGRGDGTLEVGTGTINGGADEQLGVIHAHGARAGLGFSGMGERGRGQSISGTRISLLGGGKGASRGPRTGDDGP